MGPLADLTVIELGGIGPAPFCGMLLADLGASVIRLDRVEQVGSGSRAGEPLLRNKRSLAIDLKHQDAPTLVLELVSRADALIEGFRPGVTERLGIGPDECLAANPALVYGRMTGWGQDGPLARSAGHDINYIALAGILGMIGPAGGPPSVPLNLVGDFGGGGMLLAVGVLAGVLNARATGEGQVLDAAMVDGAAMLSSMIHGLRAQGLWSDARGSNLLDGGAPFYGVYETADGGYVAVGAIEPAFYAELLSRMGLEDLPDQYDRTGWRDMRTRLATEFLTRPMYHWRELLEGTDACFAPVLSVDEAAHHPHNQQRALFIDVDEVRQPAPAPRFERTPSGAPTGPRPAGADTDVILADLGLAPEDIARLRSGGAVA
jgi:alpha-methylacyl-CoA racemase